MRLRATDRHGEAARVRDRLVIGLGFLAILGGVVLALVINRMQPATVATWAGRLAPLGAAATALLFAELVRGLLQRRPLSLLLLLFALFGLNAIFFVTELLLLVVVAIGG